MKWPVVCLLAAVVGVGMLNSAGCATFDEQTDEDRKWEDLGHAPADEGTRGASGAGGGVVGGPVD